MTHVRFVKTGDVAVCREWYCIIGEVDGKHNVRFA